MTDLGTWTGDKVVEVNKTITVTYTVTSATGASWVTNGCKVVPTVTGGDTPGPANRIWTAVQANSQAANALTVEFTTKTKTAADITEISVAVSDANS